jgi:hypothetical protein
MVSPSPQMLSGTVDAKSSAGATENRRTMLEAEVASTYRIYMRTKFGFALLIALMFYLLYHRNLLGSLPFVFNIVIMAVILSPVLFLEFRWRNAKKALKTFDEGG